MNTINEDEQTYPEDNYDNEAELDAQEWFEDYTLNTEGHR